MRSLFTSRTVSVLVVLASCGWLCSPYGMSQTLPDTIDRLRPTVVRVVRACSYETEAELSRRSGGTGFLVSEEGFVLTAAHVVEPCPASVQGATAGERRPLRAQHFSIGFALPHTGTDQTHTRENFTFVGAEIVDSDGIHDVALLRVSQNPFRIGVKSGYTLNGAELELGRPNVAILSTREVREGEAIAISGYPLDLDHPVFDTNAGIVASVHSSRDFRLPTYFNSATDQLQARVGFDLYEADTRVNHGNSGGPVYDVSSGEVIGICSAFRLAPLEGADNQSLQNSDYGYNSGLAVIVPIAYGTMLMSKHKIAIPRPGEGVSFPVRR